MRVVAASAFLLACMHVSGASAQSLSCGGFLAGVGESKYSVVDKCGEPVSKEFVCVPRYQSEWISSPYPGGAPRQILSQQCIPMEDWVYHRGPGNFLGIVRFYNGTVESIRDGEKPRR